MAANSLTFTIVTEGISKFAVKLCSPMQEIEIVYIVPKHLHK